MVEALLILVIVLSAFFSGIEIAFVSANKLRLEIDKARTGPGALTLRQTTRSSPRLIATLLIGNNLALVVYGLLMSKLMQPHLEVWFPNEATLLFIQTLLATVFILLFCEYIPKAMFAGRPNYYLRVFSIPVWIFYQLFYWPVVLIAGISQFIVKLIFRNNVEDKNRAPDKLDLGIFLEEAQSNGTVEDEETLNEVEILKKALAFPNLKAKECMVPRTEITATTLSDSIENVQQLFLSSGHSKIIIYEDTLDEVVGFIHAYALFNEPNSINDMLVPVTYVPETMPVRDLLSQFIQHRKSIAIVVDEYGGTSGLITLEDIIEEIFGEIDDEHDADVKVEKQLSDSSWQFSARLEIDHLNENWNLEIPREGDYETLAGFILHHHPTIPSLGDLIQISPFHIEITRVSGARIDEVILKKTEE
jgi:putative hemolysin